MLEIIDLYEPYTFEGYWIVFNFGLKHLFFDDGYCYGIKFRKDDLNYELIHNRVGLTRILISSKEGFNRDLPFNESTIGLLPKEVFLRKIPTDWKNK